MKRIISMIVIIVLVLSVFMTGALADKPDKTPKPAVQNEDVDDPDDGDGQDDADTEDEESGPKNVNEKRDAKKLFKEETRPLIDEIHANRAEWGALGELQGDVSDSIDAQIDGIIEGEGVLDEAALALVKEKMTEIKELKVSMRGLKDEIHTLWKEYIKAKKISNIEYATVVLNSIIEKQELRIGIRQQIVTAMSELCPVLDIEVPVLDTGDSDEDDTSDDEGDTGNSDEGEGEAA